MRKAIMLVPILLAACAASTDDLPAADEYYPDYKARPIRPAQEIWEPTRPMKRAPTKWIVRVEGERGEYLIPIVVAKKFGLRAGQTISIETARLIAEEMGAEYPDDILEKLEKLK